MEQTKGLGNAGYLVMGNGLMGRGGYGANERFGIGDGE